MRRITPVLAAALLVLATLVAGPQAAFAAQKPTTGTVVVHITSPSKVPASIVLQRLHSTTRLLAGKPASGTTHTSRLKAAPSTYRVSIPSFVYKGVQYGGSASKSRIVVRKSRTTAVSVRIRALPGSRSFTATSISTSSIGLSWTAPKHAQVVLRRAAGKTAPAKRTSGSAVKVTGHSVRDARLKAGTTYSYSLFTKVKGHWTGPLVLHSRTSTAGQSVKAAYVAQPGTVFATAKQVSTETPTGSGVSVVLKPGAPVAQVGQALILPISTSLPGGYLGVVTGIAADGRTVQLRPAGLADAFQQYSLDAGDAALGSASSMKRTVTHFSRTASAKRVRPYDDSSGSESSESPTKLGCEPSIGADAEVTFRHKIGLDKHVKTTLSHGDATFDLAFSATALGALDADIDSGAGGACTAHILTGAHQVTVDPVPLMVKWDLSASFAVTAPIKVTNLGAQVTGGFGTRGSVGLHGFQQTSYPIVSGQTLTPSVTSDNTTKVELKLGGSVAFGPGVGNSGAGAMVGVKAEVDPLDAKAVIGTAVDGSNGPCTNLSAGLHWEASLDAEAWLGIFHAGATAKLLGGDYPYFDAFYLPSACNTPPADTGSGSGTGSGGGSTDPTPTPTPTAATDVRTISNATTTTDLNCTLNTNEDSQGEYFEDSACGTFLSVGGTLYGPASIPAGSGLSSTATPVAWTPLSQTSSGSGTSADPYVTVTTAAAGTSGFQLVQTDQWVAGSSQVTTRMQVVNTTGSTQSVRLYHAFDCYTADDDTGTGGIDAANQTVGCVHVNSDNAAVLSLRLHAVTPGATWSEGGYYDNWRAVSAQGDLSDTAVTDGDYDNGEAIAWATDVPAGGTSTYDAITSFGGPM